MAERKSGYGQLKLGVLKCGVQVHQVLGLQTLVRDLASKSGLVQKLSVLEYIEMVLTNQF